VYCRNERYINPLISIFFICKSGYFMQRCCPSVCLSQVCCLKCVLLLAVRVGQPHRGCPKCFLPPRKNSSPPSIMNNLLVAEAHLLEAPINMPDLLTSRVTTRLENLEMSGNLTAVREMSGILLKTIEFSGEKSRKGKVA